MYRSYYSIYNFHRIALLFLIYSGSLVVQVGSFIVKIFTVAVMHSWYIYSINHCELVTKDNSTFCR